MLPELADGYLFPHLQTVPFTGPELFSERLKCILLQSLRMMKGSCKLEHIWLRSVRGSSCARLPVGSKRLLGFPWWCWLVLRHEMQLWGRTSQLYEFSAQRSTSIHYFQSLVTSFWAAGTVKVSLFFFISLDHLTHALTRQSFLLLHASFLYSLSWLLPVLSGNLWHTCWKAPPSQLLFFLLFSVWSKQR